MLLYAIMLFKMQFSEKKKKKYKTFSSFFDKSLTYLITAYININVEIKYYIICY